MRDFYTLLTTVGANAFANANTATLNLSTISVSDDTATPTIDQTSMQSVKWSGPIVDYVKDANIPGRFTVSCIIPSDQGGFAVNQAGLFDSAGNLLVIAKLSGSYKPIAAQGEVKELRVNLVVNATNLDSVAVTIDPNVVVATRAYVGAAITAIENRLGDHVNSTNNPHQTTKTQVGLGNVDNYATATQAEAEAGTAGDRFMTPARVKQAIAANASQGSSISTYRFMAVGTVYVPTSASEFRVIVDHSVNLSGGDCIVSEQAGSTIVTPYGSDQLIRLTSKGAEYIFSKVNGVWRIS